MLNTKRLGAIVMNKATYVNALQSTEISKALEEIITVDCPLPINYGYHYLHKKHKQLINFISEKLADLERSGYIKIENIKHREHINHILSVQ